MSAVNSNTEMRESYETHDQPQEPAAKRAKFHKTDDQDHPLGCTEHAIQAINEILQSLPVLDFGITPIEDHTFHKVLTLASHKPNLAISISELAGKIHRIIKYGEAEPYQPLISAKAVIRSAHSIYESSYKTLIHTINKAENPHIGNFFDEALDAWIATHPLPDGFTKNSATPRMVLTGIRKGMILLANAANVSLSHNPLFDKNSSSASIIQPGRQKLFLQAAEEITKANDENLVSFINLLHVGEYDDTDPTIDTPEITAILKNRDTTITARNIRDWIKNYPEQVSTITGIFTVPDGRAGIVPFEIEKFQGLTCFYWRTSTMTTLPPSFGKLASLVELDLEANHSLKQLPPCIAKLEALESILLDYELLEGDSYVLSNLGQLSTIKIRFDQGDTTRTFSIPFLNAMFCGFLKFYHENQNLPHLEVANRYNQIFGEIGAHQPTAESAASWANTDQYITIKADDVKAFQCGLRIYNAN